MARAWAPVVMFREFANHKVDDPELALEKTVLDCGAGGRYPPLALFHQHGYDAFGIDISQTQIEYAQAFCAEYDIALNLQRGDVRNLPFEDRSFSFVYEFWSIGHLTKVDIAVATREMIRVLKKGGYLFLGFMTSDIWPNGPETRPGSGEVLFHEGGSMVLHSIYDDNEPDQYFAGMTIALKEKRILWMGPYRADQTREEWNADWKRRGPATLRRSGPVCMTSGWNAPFIPTCTTSYKNPYSGRIGSDDSPLEADGSVAEDE
jgi:SAM-dependent methyltransferase